MAQQPDLMTPKQVMEYLQISEPTLYRYVRDGKLQPVRITPRTVRYRKSDIDALIDGGSADE